MLYATLIFRKILKALNEYKGGQQSLCQIWQNDIDQLGAWARKLCIELIAMCAVLKNGFMNMQYKVSPPDKSV